MVREFSFTPRAFSLTLPHPWHILNLRAGKNRFSQGGKPCRYRRPTKSGTTENGIKLGRREDSRPFRTLSAMALRFLMACVATTRNKACALPTARTHAAADQLREDYRMEFPYTAEELSSVAIELVRLNKLDACYVRPIALRGYGEVGVKTRCTRSSRCTWRGWRWGAYLGPEALAQGCGCLRQLLDAHGAQYGCRPCPRRRAIT